MSSKLNDFLVTSSFLRKQESRKYMGWIPAQKTAGMTNYFCLTGDKEISCVTFIFNASWTSRKKNRSI